MRVQFDLVGSILPFNDWRKNFTIDMDDVPREGEIISIPGLSQADTVVRTVVWYPFGKESDEEVPSAAPFTYLIDGVTRAIAWYPSSKESVGITPFVYVVIGKARP